MTIAATADGHEVLTAGNTFLLKAFRGGGQSDGPEGEGNQDSFQSVLLSNAGNVRSATYGLLTRTAYAKPFSILHFKF